MEKLSEFKNPNNELELVLIIPSLIFAVGNGGSLYCEKAVPAKNKTSAINIFFILLMPF
jgi:hypothetical protein